MSKLTFFKDQPSGFECTVAIKGAAIAKSKARLVLYFTDRTLMFESDLMDNKVSIKIPQLNEIEDSYGRAVLEVIADSSYFEAWESDFDLEYKTSVSVNELQIDRTESATVTIGEVESFEVERSDEVETEFAEKCSPKNERFAKTILTELETMDETERSDLDSVLCEFKPNEDVQKWSESVFENSTTRLAKFCMYKVQTALVEK